MCDQNTQGCNASVTTCDPKTGEQVVHTTQQTCQGSGGGDGGSNPFPPGGPTPILIDVGGDEFSLTSFEDGVMFAIDADGRPQPASWTADANSREAHWRALACIRG